MKIVNCNINNVCIIGDVHSSPNELQHVINKAKKNNIDNFIFLGDLWDRGYDPNGVVDIIYNLKEKAKVIVGNHDYKFLRHFDGSEVVIAEQQQQTLSKITESSIDRFRTIFQDGIVAMFDPINKIFMSHGAAGRPLNILRHLLDDVNRERIVGDKITLDDMFRMVKEIPIQKKRYGNFMYGKTNGDTINGLPVRLPITTNEEDSLDGWTYFYGHIHASNIFPENGNKHSVCLDYCCGESKGKLAGLLLRDNKVSLENVIFSS